MSLPSIPAIAKEKGFHFSTLSQEQVEILLVEAMRRDLPDAVTLLHQKAHEADKTEAGAANWLEDPNSSVGKQLIRLHASDALRPLASKHFCHGKDLTFINCCGGVVGTKPPLAACLDLQVKMQAGPIAYSDC